MIGVAVAAPVGAMGALCIGRTLRGGWRQGLATGFGIATADTVYAAVAAFGLTAVSSLLVSFSVPLRVVGGIVLIVLAVRTALSEPCLSAEGDVRPALAVYASAFGLTLTNPATILAFGAIFASAGLLETQGEFLRALAATVGIALGSLAWWLLLVGGVALGRSRMGPRALRAINVGSGVVIGGFGVTMLLSVLAS